MSGEQAVGKLRSWQKFTSPRIWLGVALALFLCVAWIVLESPELTVLAIAAFAPIATGLLAAAAYRDWRFLAAAVAHAAFAYWLFIYLFLG